MYRTVGIEIWTDPKFQALPPLGKLLFFHLFTNHHAHVCGLYHLPDIFVSYETGIDQPTLDTLWDTLSGAGLCWRDKKTSMVWVKNMLKRQGSGDKIMRSTATHLETLHKCPAIKHFVDKYPGVKPYLKNTLWDTPSDGVSEFGILNSELGTGTGTGLRTEGASKKSEPKTGTSFADPESEDPIKRLDGWELSGLGKVTSDPRVKTEMAKWILDLRARTPPKSPTPTQWREQIARLEAMGVDGAIRAIKFSLANGYAGIVEEKIKNGAPANGPPRTAPGVSSSYTQSIKFGK